MDRLDALGFENIVTLLLQKKSLTVISPTTDEWRRTHAADVGVNIVAETEQGSPVYVIVKHYRGPRGVSTRDAERAIEFARRIRSQVPNSSIIFATSKKMTTPLIDDFRAADIDVWDDETIDALLHENFSIRRELERLIKTREPLELLFGSRTPTVPTTTLAEQVSSTLTSIPPGKEGWRKFELASTRIITEIFIRDLEPPEMQMRTDDHLDIMDAIFPIPQSNSPWSALRSEFKTRFVIAEFKNYSDPVGQRQVESITQYLLPKAFRMFGLLVSRKPPTDSALAARRRAWIEQDKMIVLIDDDDLIEMAQLRDADDRSPYEVIDRQLTHFFRTLSV